MKFDTIAMFQVEYFENSTKLSNVKLTSDEPETQVKYAYFIEGGNTTIQQLYPPYIVSLWIKMLLYQNV